MWTSTNLLAWPVRDVKYQYFAGTGCNACYLERLENVELWDGDLQDSSPREVIINMESGAFGDDGVLDFVRTEFDRAIDEESLNKGCQTYVSCRVSWLVAFS